MLSVVLRELLQVPFLQLAGFEPRGHEQGKGNRLVIMIEP